MKAQFNLKQSAVIGAVVASFLSQSVFAHTRLETASIAEGTRAYNNIVIGHGCGTKPVTGTSVVFPDGVSSTIIVGGQVHNGPLTDFVANWGPSISAVQSSELFNDGGVKKGPTGKVVGFWAGGGRALSTDMIGRVPFRVNATNIEKASCAVSVRFFVSIVDVCEVTPQSQLQTGGHDGGVVGLWTHHDLGTPFDAAASGGPASLTITRNLTTNPLPSSCGTGVSVDVKPSAAQILRDMPVKVNGTQIWPQ